MSDISHAVILAGGQGTRLRPVTLEIPKPLIPVQGLPIATWLVRLFVRHGVTTVSVIYPTSRKTSFEQWGLGIRNEVPELRLLEETEPMGTMGYLVHEMSFADEPIFVTNGDELKGLDLSALADVHRQRSHPVTIALVRVPNPSEYGVAEMDGDRIVRFHEKPEIPPSTLISSGLYVVHPRVFRDAPRDRRFLMFERDLFPRLAKEGKLGGCPLGGAWYDCGTMERWEKAIREWGGE